ncbi:MAG: flavin reductase family protein [bacterium]
MGKKKLNPSTFLMPCPIGLITTQGRDGKPNIITLAWIGIIASEPPMVNISVRTSRYSYKLLKENGDFVINIPSARDLAKVDFCGTVSGKNTDKFKEANFTFEPGGIVKAPIINECPVNIECRTKEVLHFLTHDAFLAEILSVHVNEEVLDNEGRWQIEKIDPLTYCPPSQEYWTLGKKVGKYGFTKGKI